MICKLVEHQQTELLQLPETGMGYQIIEAKLHSFSTPKKYVVFNSEVAVDTDVNLDYYSRELYAKGIEKIKGQLDTMPFASFELLTARQKARLFSDNKPHKSKGAKENPKEKANGTEMFVRLSAYENDRRIDFESKKLKPESYTTTLKDYLECKAIGDDPIARYALPNNEEIKWAFHIRPKYGDILQRGIVQPAFEHDGGGEEAYFEYGTSINTLLKKATY